MKKHLILHNRRGLPSAAGWLMLLCPILLSQSASTNPNVSAIEKGSPIQHRTRRLITDPSFRLTKTQQLSDPYVVAGRRAYLVGSQGGRFPDIGHHIPGEMGGLWSQPIKIIDGFWLGLGRGKEVQWLPPATTYWTTPLESGHMFNIPESHLRVEQRTFISQQDAALVITYFFTFEDDSPQPEFIPVAFFVRTDLQGTWLSERVGWINGPDSAYFDAPTGCILARDGANAWFACIGAQNMKALDHRIGAALLAPEQTVGTGISCQLRFDVPLDENGTGMLRIVVSGSASSAEEAVAVWQDVAVHLEDKFSEKQQIYQELLDQSALSIPDKQVQQTYDWIKFNYEMLIQDVPGYGFGLGAGIPTYAWWFGCDNTYALQGALTVGMHDLAKETLKLLARYSEQVNGNGRIIHEVVTNGEVYNPGNTQETAHFVMAVYTTFLWTGDMDFLKSLYPLCRQGALEWLLDTMDIDRDLFPEGYGIMEVAGLNWELIDAAVYTQQALVSVAKMARILEDEATALRSEELAVQLAKRIEERYWQEAEGLYADVIAPPRIFLERLPQIRNQDGYQNERVKAVLDDYEEIARANAPDQELPWQFKNWVIFCPVEVGIAAAERAFAALQRMQTAEFTGEHGLFLSGIRRQHIMSISTGVAAVAQARYGQADAALDYIRRIASTQPLHWPGAPSEMSPNYGNPIQAWSGYGVAYPIVSQFFGIQPNAREKRILLAPHLPDGWNNAYLSNVWIGTNQISIGLEVSSTALTIQLETSESDWEIEFILPRDWLPFGKDPLTVRVNGETILDKSMNDQLTYRLPSSGYYEVNVSP